MIGSRDNVDPKYPAASIFFNGTKIIEIRQEMMEKEDNLVRGGGESHSHPPSPATCRTPSLKNAINVITSEITRFY